MTARGLQRKWSLSHAWSAQDYRLRRGVAAYRARAEGNAR